MANEEQLAILQQDVPVWNAWLKKHPDFKVVLVMLFIKAISDV